MYIKIKHMSHTYTKTQTHAGSNKEMVLKTTFLRVSFLL